MLCKYRNILGTPRKRVHSIRVFDIAIIDVALTFLAAWGLYKWLKIPFWIALVSLFVIGILLHRLFCVNTKVNVALFGKIS